MSVMLWRWVTFLSHPPHLTNIMKKKRKYDLEHRNWAEAIKWKFDGGCIVCGATNYLSAHHLIPWDIEKFRFNYNNGVALCPKHHTKYGYGLSPHSHGSILFVIFLNERFPKILEWVEENYDS